MVALNLKMALVVLMIMAALATVAGNVLAKKNDDGSRPGWGHGDKNHTHTGPPGQSVHPGHHDEGDDEDDDRDKDKKEKESEHRGKSDDKGNSKKH